MISCLRTIINRKFEGLATVQTSHKPYARGDYVIANDELSVAQMRVPLCRQRKSSNNSMHFSVPLAAHVATSCHCLSLALLHATLTRARSNASYDTSCETDRVISRRFSSFVPAHFLKSVGYFPLDIAPSDIFPGRTVPPPRQFRSPVGHFFLAVKAKVSRSPDLNLSMT